MQVLIAPPIAAVHIFRLKFRGEMLINRASNFLRPAVLAKKNLSNLRTTMYARRFPYDPVELDRKMEGQSPDPYGT